MSYFAVKLWVKSTLKMHLTVSVLILTVYVLAVPAYDSLFIPESDNE